MEIGRKSVGIFMLAIPSLACAPSGWLSKRLTIIVSYPPGGGADALA